MMHDDDFTDLDRMLAALPLEEPPAGLRSRILTSTIYRAVPAAAAWEYWLVGTVLAFAVWLLWLVATAPHAGERFADVTAWIVEQGGLTSLTTLLWLAVGISTAWWISQLSFPSPRRVRTR
jgi:hypothetical protein